MRIKSMLAVGAAAAMLVTGCSKDPNLPDPTDPASTPVAIPTDGTHIPVSPGPAQTTAKTPKPTGDTDLTKVVAQVRDAMSKTKTWRVNITSTTQFSGQSQTTTTTAKGQVDQSDPANVKTHMTSESEYGKSEVIGIGSDFYMRADGQPWRREPGQPPVGADQVLVDLPDGPVNSIGEADINGVKAKGYRIQGDRQVVDIFVDSQNRLVRSTSQVSGDASTTQSQVDYYDFDAPANIVAPI